MMEPTDKAKAPEEKDYAALFTKSILDQTRDYPLPQPILIIHQHGIEHVYRTKKSFSLQQGKQKSKKTTELVIEVAAFIREIPQPECNIWFECKDPGVVLFVDCEQGESYAARTMKLALKLAGLTTSQNLKYLDLREFPPKDRLNIIKAGILLTPNVKWVIIDGIVDIMDDFMDAKEGQLVITDLLRLTSQFDIHVTGVLHQNKGQSKDARAHVGSIASQKCELELMVEKDPEDKAQSIVSGKETRGLGFDDFAIRWDAGGLPHIVQDWSPGPTIVESKRTRLSDPIEFPESTHLEALTKIFTSKKELTSGEFISGLMAAWLTKGGGNMAASRAKTFRSFYIQEGYLVELPHQSKNRTLNRLSDKYSQLVS